MIISLIGVIVDKCFHVSTQSSASDRQIRDAAAGIREAFTVLEDKEFFSFSFISENSHRYKKGLYEYCTTEATPLTIMTSNLADQTFISLVEQNQLTKALIRVLNCHNCSALSRSFGKTAFLHLLSIIVFGSNFSALGFLKLWLSFALIKTQPNPKIVLNTTAPSLKRSGRKRFLLRLMLVQV